MNKWILVLALLGAGCSSSPKQEEAVTEENPIIHPEIDAKRVVKGSVDAPVTILEYGDFQCPACAYGAKNLKIALNKHGDKVRFIFKHLPLPYHPQARPAAQAYEVLRARDPAKAFEFYEAAYAEPGLLNSKAELEKLFKRFKLSAKTVEAEFKKLKLEEMFESDKSEFLAFGFRGTPVFIVNGRPLEGAPSAMDFDKVIEASLPK